MRIKKYISHVTLISADCPYEHDDIDVMDADEADAIMSEFGKRFTIEFECQRGQRDHVFGMSMKQLLESYPDFEIHHQTVPAFDGWA